MNAPFGLKTEWESGWVGRFHAIKSEVLTVNINPSVAWKINEMFSVGRGRQCHVHRRRADQRCRLQRDRTTLPGGAGANLTALATPGVCPGAVTGISPLVGGGSNCEGVAKVKGDDWGWGWNLGAMINLSPATRIGLAYRSTVTQKLDGDVSFSNRPATAAFAAAVPNSGVSAEIKLPDMFSVGVSHAFGQFQVLADYTWTGWDSIQDLTIVRSSGATLANTPLRFKNSWRAGLGVNYQLNARVEAPVRNRV